MNIFLDISDTSGQITNKLLWISAEKSPQIFSEIIELSKEIPKCLKHLRLIRRFLLARQVINRSISFDNDQTATGHPLGLSTRRRVGSKVETGVATPPGDRLPSRLRGPRPPGSQVSSPALSSSFRDLRGTIEMESFPAWMVKPIASLDDAMD